MALKKLLMMSMLMLISTLVLCNSMSYAQDSYTAAVVELSPMIATSSHSTPSEANAIINTNLATMALFVAQAASQGAQIIVFPEYGLFGENFSTRDSIYPFLEEIPSVEDQANPCSDPSSYAHSPALYQLSCLARNYSIDVVVDMGEVLYCNETNYDDCPSDGRFQFNVQVVFGSDGTLIGKYRKIHLYQEPYYNSSPTKQIGYFDSSFGVRFGQIICFDLAFRDPSFELLYNKSLGISNVVFSTAWVNFPPFELAPEAQAAWSRFYGANLLAAGFGGLGYQSSGSGVYSNGTVIDFYFNPTDDGQNVLIVATVPLLQASQTKMPINQLSPLTQFNLRSEMLIPSIHAFSATPGSSGSYQGSSGNLTCYGSYTVSEESPSSSPQQYAFITFDIFDIPDVVPAPIKFCGFVVCDDELKACGLIDSSGMPTATGVFSSLNVTGNFASDYSVWGLSGANNGNLLIEQTSVVKTQDGFSLTLLETNNILNFGLFSIIGV